LKDFSSIEEVKTEVYINYGPDFLSLQTRKGEFESFYSDDNFFGIPITISESLIYNLMSKAGAVFQLGSFLHTNINVLIFSFIICVCVSFVLAWPLAKFCLRIFESLNKKKLYIGIIIIGIFSVVMAGYYANDIKTYLLVMTTMTLIGYSLRKFDLLPLIFVFIMQNSIESIFYNIIKIYL